MKEIEEEETNSRGIIHRNSQTALTIDQDIREEEPIKTYDYKSEAIKGNFMPSIIKLEKQEAKINEVICSETGNTLLHLAVNYSFYNVIRTYIKLFKADINIRNLSLQTPLHLNCKNVLKDAIVLSYLITNPSINIEAEDQTGLRAIDYAVINNFNIGFLFLIAKGTDLIKTDQMGNGLIYYGLVNDNKFVVSFLYTHLPTYAINATFYDQQVSLSDVLITNKNSSICKLICKYYFDVVEKEKIESCTRFISEFSFYSRFNYELLNTMLFFKQGNNASFLNGLFPLMCCCLRKKVKYYHSNNNNYKSNGLDTSVNRQIYYNNCEKAVNNDICYDNVFYNLKIYFYYYLLKKYPKIHLSIFFSYIILLYTVKPFTVCDIKDWVAIVSLCTMITLTIISMIGIFFKWHHDSIFVKEKHSYRDSANNVFNSLLTILQKNQLGLFPTEETICEICLIHKDKSTNHCRQCNRCVRQFYFHSLLFNRCFSRSNIYLYLLFLLSMLFAHCSYGTTLWNRYSSMSSPHYYLFTKLIIGLHKANPLITIMIIYIIVICGVIIGKMLSLIICIGTDVPYYNVYRYHKKDIGEKIKRNNQYVGIPKVNMNTLKQFGGNLCCYKKKE